MENAEEVLQCLDEFSKVKPKDIPRELEEYLCFVAKTGDPIYQWPIIKCLFREKLLSVVTEFYEACPSIEIPPCPNVDSFNYDTMKSFILEKLDAFAAAPFTVQRICELLTTPRKEYNRIDKYMRALEKNILVVSTREPGNRRNNENGESVVNGLETETNASDTKIEGTNAPVWPKTETPQSYDNADAPNPIETVITARPINYIGYTPNITDLIVEPQTTTADAESTDAFEANFSTVIQLEPSATEEKSRCTENAYASVIQLEPVPSVVYVTETESESATATAWEPKAPTDSMDIDEPKAAESAAEPMVQIENSVDPEAPDAQAEPDVQPEAEAEPEVATTTRD